MRKLLIVLLSVVFVLSLSVGCANAPTAAEPPTTAPIDFSDSFAVYVGNTSREQYEAYIDKCAEKGFTVDYGRQSHHYFAYNEEGWFLDVRYLEGQVKVMYIEIILRSKI